MTLDTATQDEIDRLNRAVDERSDHVPYLKVNPRVDPLRSDPRFQALFRKINWSGIEK